MSRLQKFEESIQIEKDSCEADLDNCLKRIFEIAKTVDDPKKRESLEFNASWAQRNLHTIQVLNKLIKG